MGLKIKIALHYITETNLSIMSFFKKCTVLTNSPWSLDDLSYKGTKGRL